MDHYDFIIMGTGAGGATIAHQLALAGKKILILERGGFLPKEADNWRTKAVFTEGKYLAKETWLDKNGKTFHPGIHYFVGGNTKFFGAALLRFRKEDFGEIQHWGGISPAWPIQYDELEPYYTKAEALYYVHGQSGIDPTEPSRSQNFPYQPLQHEPKIQALYDDFKKIGHHPFPLPMGVRLGNEFSYPQPTYHIEHFDGYPDPTESKSDAHVISINPILNYDNVTFKIHSDVEKLITGPSGKKITEVHVDENGKKIKYTGDIIIVSCGAINSALLLLRSANDKHPNGLANSSDMVGRNYMCHNNSAMLSLSKNLNPTKFGKTFAINDFYLKDDNSSYPLGHIQMLAKSDGEQLKGDAPRFTPHFVLDFMAQHAIDFWITSEDLPDPTNRVFYKDGKVCLHYTENNLEAHHRLIAKLKTMLDKIAGKNIFSKNMYFNKKIPLAGTAHQNGTLRFGHDPKTSVLDVNCKAHDVDNLYVVDSSFFVSSTAVNPGLTIMANALRVADHLLKR